MNIKSSFFIVLAFCSFNLFYGQTNLKIEKSVNSRLIKVLNNSELIAENSEPYLSVRIYKVDNGSGSAGFESCEVSFNLLIAVSEFDQLPKQNLFEFGPLLNPSFLKWVETNNKKEFIIEYGLFDKRQRLKLVVTINELLKGK
jgi:hypothetical protein